MRDARQVLLNDDINDEAASHTGPADIVVMIKISGGYQPNIHISLPLRALFQQLMICTSVNYRHKIGDNRGLIRVDVDINGIYRLQHIIDYVIYESLLSRRGSSC